MKINVMKQTRIYEGGYAFEIIKSIINLHSNKLFG